MNMNEKSLNLPSEEVESSYSIIKTGEELEKYVADISETVRISLDQSISILTPWFFSNMPNIYYQTTPRAEKVRHLTAVMTGHIFESKQTVELWDKNRTKVTFIGPGGDYSNIINIAAKMKDYQLKMGSLYFSRDKLLFLATFFYKDFLEVDKKNKHITDRIKETRKIIEKTGEYKQEDIQSFFDHLDHDFVTYSTPNRLFLTFKMLIHMLNHEGAHTYLEQLENSNQLRMTIGIKGIDCAHILENVLQFIVQEKFEIDRYFLIQFQQGYSEPIAVMHFILDHEKIPESRRAEVTKKLVKAQRTLAWVDVDDYTMFTKEPFLLSINAANLVRSLASWTHVLTSKENVYYYSEYKIFTTFSNHSEYTLKLVELFRIKFDPSREEERKSKVYETFRADLLKDFEKISDRVEKVIFLESIKFIDHCLKTNYFLQTKTGLAFRLDPIILNEKYYPQKPFGIFFIIGRDYRLFQVRWKDIARGGLRIILPKTNVDYGYALSGLFDEVYGLSLAQQLKNKDIPEGGSKAVMVVRPGANKSRAVRGGINALLDLLVPKDESDENVANKIVSYYKKEEIIYLGPDENMTNDLIVWVSEQAKRRGYMYASAFISSKPGAGINHKEYGVTSEGLNVYVEYMLKYLGIDPKKESFTLKMTGGPDGDVAGNELKILHRQFGSKAKVVAIADGYGAAHDPEGLNWEELLRLVEQGLPISDFSEKKLSQNPKAFSIKADSAKNIKIRNELHFAIKADLFIPAGGRPFTVNEGNVSRFLDEHNKPTCRAIIEGANIFFTPEARYELQKYGILIIKDSSANKTGVICSSFEVIASLILNEEEFLKIKDAYVSEVISILREKAALEAQLLFSEYEHCSGSSSLVELSMKISKVINEVTDTMLEKFTEHQDETLSNPIFQRFILRHCPPLLQKNYEQQILEKLPTAHKIAILSTYCAAYVVYREGLDWLGSLSKEAQFKSVVSYMENEELIASFVKEIDDSSIKDKKSIASIIQKSGAKYLTVIGQEK